MASLNTLRTRGALFLSIFIGIALVAFLLGDLTTAGSIFQSRRNRVGQINGKNIDYMDFYAQTEKMGRIADITYGGNAPEHDELRDRTWEMLIRRWVYAPGFEKIGIAVGEAEQADMVRGTYISPIISGFFAVPNSATGKNDFSPELLKEFIANLSYDTSGRLTEVWEFIKSEMVAERALSKYATLLSGGVFANDLETARGTEDANDSFSGVYVTIPYSSVADSLVSVGSREIKDYYNKHKNNYKRTASRDIDYVLFDIDIEYGQEDVTEDGGYTDGFNARFDSVQSQTYNRARDFVTLTGGSSKKFAAAADSVGVSPRSATINHADRGVRELIGSGELVRWSWNAKVGTLSTIFEIDNGYVVAVLRGAREDGFSSLASVSSTISGTLLREKKGAVLVSQMADKSFDQVLAMAGATEGEFTGIKFDDYYIPSLGVEPAVLGAVSVTGEGSLSKPVEGNSGVYVARVDTILAAEPSGEYAEGEQGSATAAFTATDKKSELEIAARSNIEQNLMQTLLDGSDIKDYRQKFF